MENWGLVTYRETCLLVDDQNTSTQRRQWVAIVVGHELAHQWFGNLVTMVNLHHLHKNWIKSEFFCLLRNGGLICGWTKATPRSSNRFASTISSPSSKSGRNSSPTLLLRPWISTVWRIRIPSKCQSATRMKSTRFLTTFLTTRERPSFACCTTTSEMT